MTKFTIEGTSSGQGQGSISIKPNPDNDPKSTHRGIVKLYRVTKNSDGVKVKTLKRTINLVQKAQSTPQEQYYLNLNVRDQDYQASSLGIKDITATYKGSFEFTVPLYVQGYKINSAGQTELPVIANFNSKIDEEGNGISLENEANLSNISLHTRRILLTVEKDDSSVTYTAKLVLTLPESNLRITLDVSL